MRTLLLDNGYQPVTIIGWRRAITMLWLGKVEVVEEYQEEVHSPSIAVKLPAVVRLITSFIKKRNKIRFSRQNIYLRDGGKCQYCEKEVTMSDATFDHVVPRSKGGKTDWENIVISCLPCNLKKGSKTVQQARMQLRKKPAMPKNIPYVVFSLRKVSHMPNEWKDYLASVQYWTSSLIRA